MISIKTESELSIMREAGRILALTFVAVGPQVREGISAKTLDDLVKNTIQNLGAEPGFLGYQGYKYSACISRNEEIVHGIPYADKIVLPGDIWSIDIGVRFNGYYADAARTYCVGPVSDQARKLVEVTKASFFEGIRRAVPGNRLGDVSNAIQTYVESHGFAVVKDLYSHGIGKSLHEDPLIPNYGKKGKGPVLKRGMTFALEPMVNIGTDRIFTLADKWTIVTADRKWSAHYENTILVTDENGPEILTLDTSER